jgi:folate-binding protein YgfZ
VISPVLLQPLLARVKRTGAVIPAGVHSSILVRGKDAQDLLHRLSTNDLRTLSRSGSLRTVLTNEKGRIIDWIQIRPGADMLLVICHAGAREKVRGWIERFIITEDIEVLAPTEPLEITSIIVPPANSPDVSGIEQMLIRPSDDLEFGFWADSLGPLRGMRFAALPGRSSRSIERIGLHDAAILSVSEYTALRVLAGVPSNPEELNEGHNPLESILRHDVSFSKGCYIGQEVIARLDAFDKVQRELVVLRVDGVPGFDDQPDEILFNGAPAGSVTSIGGVLADGPLMVMGYIEKGVRAKEGILSTRCGAAEFPARAFVTGDVEGWPWEMTA